MQKKSISRLVRRSLGEGGSAFFNLRTLIGLFLCAATAYFILIPMRSGFAFLRAPSNGSQRTLTFEERVSHQLAIEEVYWRHRIWPKENSNPKPSLDAVMSQAQVEKKVTDYLRKSQALEDYWQRAITTDQLQAEMDRMAQHTKQPEVLQELFGALGNDPFIITECLARPALADRLLTSWYAYDQRIHGELKERAEAELRSNPAVGQMKQLGGKYSEIELARKESAHPTNNGVAAHVVKLDNHAWDRIIQRLVEILGDNSVAAGVSPAPARLSSQRQTLASTMSPSKDASITQIKTGVLSQLQEDESRYYVTAVIEKTNNHLKLATVSWPKEPLQSWLARAESHLPPSITALGGDYRLPKTLGGGCIDDTWTATAGPPDARSSHTAIWTGNEMIVWGGTTSLGSTYLDTGARYNPSTDTWTVTSTANAPTARAFHTAIWTGSEMIVWGGYAQDGRRVLNTGGRYDPNTDSWTATSTTDAPTGRENQTAVWTGSEMIVWGGYDTSGFVANTGGKYNAGTNSWTATSTTNAPVARSGHTAVWTGDEMIVWGGYDNTTGVNTGARYDPGSNSWTATSVANAPAARYDHTAVWTGNELIVWGGIDQSFNNPNTGGRYNPATNSWTATSTVNAPDGRWFDTVIWTGSQMIVWGGYSSVSGLLNTGGVYDPSTNSWAATSDGNAPSARKQHIAVWTGSEMIVWGGTAFGDVNTGGRYDPGTNSWATTGTANTPSARAYHTAVWTGSEMVVWGGSGASGVFNTGGRYDPTIDGWTTTNLINAPGARVSHTAVWSGSEMIVWGGTDENFVRLNTGGRYNPGTDSWVATSTANAPSGRYGHSAVWADSEMIVWGGTNDSTTFDTGGRYNPGTNSWTATTIANAPDGRAFHSAVWTGNEMIVWGGGSPWNYVDTGGRYNPGSNSWVATNTVNAPSPREYHTAVWSGEEMIIWGGTDLLNDFNTGGRYNPGTDSWAVTNTTNAPTNRDRHTALWTGNEMVVWGGTAHVNTGGRYNPSADSWTATSTTNAPTGRESHTSIWTGTEMILWGGTGGFDDFNSGARYCAQSGPPPTPTPTPRVTPRPRPTPHTRPTPP